VKARPEPDLKLLADAANEAAKREAAQWFYFVTIMLTLAAIVGSTTHRVLFLEDPVKVPILSVELPLRGFYLAAPAIFVVLHFYLLAQLRLMAGKVRAFLDAVEDAGYDTAARARELNRLDTFSVAQLVVADRYSRIAPAVRAMVWVTLVVAPVLLLLFFQLRFLPSHGEWITWWHRRLLAVDIALVWALWPPLESGPWTRAAIHAARGIAAGVTLRFAVFLATIPDEWADLGGRNLPLRAALFGDLSPDDVGVDQQPATLFSRRLILPDQDFVSEDEKTRTELLRTRVLRGRHLEYAVLDRADLRKADLTGAFLRGASLYAAQMQGALLFDAQMQGASLNGAQMQGASLNAAQMQVPRSTGRRPGAHRR
jgi:Pentapeptide repeats (8 copies)